MDDITQIALNFVPERDRKAVAALWQYDAMLGQIVATTTEPMIGQLRLSWWHGEISLLTADSRPAEPVTAQLQRLIGSYALDAASLAALIEGWEALLDPLPLSVGRLLDYAEGRGNGLYALTARILGRQAAPGPGAMWALVDFATRCSDRATAQRAWAAAAGPSATMRGLPKMLRIVTSVARQQAMLGSPTVTRWSVLRAILS